MFKKIICVDFDGVIHSYKSGWKGIDVIPDPPVKGALEWLERLIADPEIEPVIYSSRSKNPLGINAMRAWFSLYDFEWRRLEFPTQKPPAFLTIDDRAMCFIGIFPTLSQIKAFKPWNKVDDAEPSSQNSQRNGAGD